MWFSEIPVAIIEEVDCSGTRCLEVLQLHSIRPCERARERERVSEKEEEDGKGGQGRERQSERK